MLACDSGEMLINYFATEQDVETEGLLPAVDVVTLTIMESGSISWHGLMTLMSSSLSFSVSVGKLNWLISN